MSGTRCLDVERLLRLGTQGCLALASNDSESIGLGRLDTPVEVAVELRYLGDLVSEKVDKIRQMREEILGAACNPRAG